MPRSTRPQNDLDDGDIVPHEDVTNDYTEKLTATTIANEDIAKVAYYRYIGQGSHPGHDIEHWLEAELQLREMHANYSKS